MTEEAETAKGKPPGGIPFAMQFAVDKMKRGKKKFDASF